MHDYKKQYTDLKRLYTVFLMSHLCKCSTASPFSLFTRADLVNCGISDRTGRQHKSILPISSLVNNASPGDPQANFTDSAFPTWMPSSPLGELLSGAQVWRNRPGPPADTEVRSHCRFLTVRSISYI